jgi:hypothetical protein
LTSAPVLVANRGSGYPSCPRTQPQVFSAGAIAPAPFFISASGNLQNIGWETICSAFAMRSASRFRKKLAVEAVIGEPVSTRSSLFHGKIQGNFAIEVGEGATACAFANKFKAFRPNSLIIETGNFADRTGNCT